MDEDKLAAIKARRDAATPGPYAYDPNDSNASTEDHAGSIRTADDDGWWIAKLEPDSPLPATTAEFLASSWEDTGVLIEEVERLQDERAECARMINVAGPLAHRIQVLLNERGEALNEVWRLQKDAARLDELERLRSARNIYTVDSLDARRVVVSGSQGGAVYFGSSDSFREAADYSLSRQPAVTPAPAQMDAVTLKDGPVFVTNDTRFKPEYQPCRCGHGRRRHISGKGDCLASIPDGGLCSCSAFVPPAVTPEEQP